MGVNKGVLAHCKFSSEDTHRNGKEKKVAYVKRGLRVCFPGENVCKNTTKTFSSTLRELF